MVLLLFPMCQENGNDIRLYQMTINHIAPCNRLSHKLQKFIDIFIFMEVYRHSPRLI
jgi:uncharacterized membrane protein (DUF373 family)